jgi:hypothetical protein
MIRRWNNEYKKIITENIMTISTYSEVTVASAAPLTPRPSGKISTASSIAFNKLPAPVYIIPLVT